MTDITVQEDSVGKKKAGKKVNSKWLTLTFAILTVLLLGGLVFLYGKYQHVKNNPTETQKAQNSADTERVLTKLKKVLSVTETEAPTVARVEDPAKLKETNKEFYKNVQQGDYLVIYPTRAIIFREANEQIINIAPIINTPATSTEKTDTTPTTTTNANTRN